MASAQTVQLWDYWFVLRKRKLMILATLIVVLTIVTLVNMLQKPIYSAYTALIMETSQPVKVLQGGQLQPQTYQEYFDNVFFDTQVKLMHSSYFTNLVTDELYNSRSELPENLRNAQKETLRRLAAEATIITPSATMAKIMGILVENHDPKLAAYLANTFAKVYIRYTQQSQMDASRQSLIFLMQKLEDIRDKLNSSIYSITDLDVENQLAAATKVYGENHPIVQELKAKKRAIEGLSASKTKTASLATSTLAQQEEDTLDELIAEKERLAISRSAQINEQLYQVLLRKLQEFSFAGSAGLFNARVIEPARVPERPLRPNKRLNTIIGMVMGIVMGVGLAFFREYLDTTIKTVDELRNSFNLSALGLIPSIGVYKPPKTTLKLLKEHFFDKNKKETLIEKNEVRDELNFQIHRLTSADQSMAHIAEAYRTLRTNLQFTQLDRPLKTLLITSSIRGEGKTTTTVNLGIILAQMGKKILLVDTDLRRPRIHKAFNTTRDVGLTNLLMGESTLEDVVIPTELQNLTILPSGPLPPNPAELVSSERMKGLIKYMESKYDMILFDSPPLVAVTDAALLATEVDGLLLVVEAEALPRHLLKQGLDRLSSVKANILGSILNNVNLQKGSYYYYYYHYAHYDYASAEKR